MRNQKQPTLNKKLISQKREMLLHMLLEEHSDYLLCEEALNVLYEVFGDVDLTLIEDSGATFNCLATTLNNQDNINALISTLKFYLAKRGERLAETVQIKARPDVYETKILALPTGKDIKTYLIIDVYDDGYTIDKVSLKEIFDILALLVRVSVLERDRIKAYKVDSLTRLCTRDSLIKDISTVIDANILDSADVCLAALYISNATEMNKVKGYAYMDNILFKIAQILINHERKGYVYRIGGMKFAIFSKKSLQDMYALVNDIFDEIKELEPNLYCTASIIPVLDDPYKTVYGAECNLKETDNYKIAIYRDDPSQYVDDERDKFDNIEIADDNNVQYVDDIIDRKLREHSTVEIVEPSSASEEDDKDEDEDNDIVLSFDDEDEEDENDEDDVDVDEEPIKKKGRMFGKDGQMSIF